jgi:hypothetical protein
MSQKLVTTFTLLLFLLAVIFLSSINQSQPVPLEDLVFLPVISRVIL